MYDCFELLLDMANCYVPIDQLDHEGRTPLHYAVEIGSTREREGTILIHLHLVLCTSWCNMCVYALLTRP